MSYYLRVIESKDVLLAMVQSNNHSSPLVSARKPCEKRQIIARGRLVKGPNRSISGNTHLSITNIGGLVKGDKGVESFIAHALARSLNGRACLHNLKFGLAPCHPFHPCHCQRGVS